MSVWIPKLKRLGATESDIEDFEERAAIMEYMGLQDRRTAEKNAYGIVSKRVYALKRKRRDADS